MNNIYFYLILAVFLYFIFTRVLENFLVEQENFDPSLVPVSSIVTLAKVAQKLVNGNGTLTNPGNLQIGASTSAPGTLTVTGTTTVNGNSTVNKDIIINAGTGNNGIKITSGNPHIVFTKTGSTASVPQLYSDGTILHAHNAPFQVDQNLTVLGESFFPGRLTAYGDVSGATSGQIQIGRWDGGPTIYANDKAKPLIINNDGKDGDKYGKVQIGFSPQHPNDFTVTGTTTLNGLSVTGNGLSVTGSNPAPSTFAFGQTATINANIGKINIGSNNTGFDIIQGSNTSNTLLIGSQSNSGTTQIWNNDLKIDTGKTFCIGSTCINENHLKALSGTFTFMLKSNHGECVDVGTQDYAACDASKPQRIFKLQYV